VSGSLGACVRLLRPHQWVKSGFVFAGVVFAHSWNDEAAVLAACLAAAAFALAASAVYVFNDYADRERDRAHPAKRHRPLAAGTVRPATAFALGGACGAGGLALGYAAAPAVALLIVIYLLLNAAYSAGLKHQPILDVFLIATGFMLRLLAGTVGIGIEPSQWLLLCGLMLTLFLGFAKRRAERYALAEESGGAGSHRRVLDEYDPVLLDKMITVCAAGSIVTYSLYTLAPQTVALHGTERLVWTVPFVLYGMFRYLYLLHRQGGGGDPAAELFRDRQILAAVLGWLTLVVLLLR
jgi:4-hydroxybenzoate polyprenyltransferase